MSLGAAVFVQRRRALIQVQQTQCALESLLIIYQSRASDQASAATEPKTITAFDYRLLHKWFRHWTHSSDFSKAADMFCMKKKRNEARFVLRIVSLWAKERKAQRRMGEAVSLWLEGRAVSRSFHQWVKVYQQQQKASRHRQTQLSHSMSILCCREPGSPGERDTSGTECLLIAQPPLTTCYWLRCCDPTGQTLSPN